MWHIWAGMQSSLFAQTKSASDKEPHLWFYWAIHEPPHDKTNKMTCAQRRLRSACVSAQSDQSRHCPNEEALGPWLPSERTAKTLIRLGGCPGWSESSLGAHAILLVLSWGSSLYFCAYAFEGSLTIQKASPLIRVWQNIWAISWDYGTFRPP